MKANIAKAILKPFFLKKLIIGPATVPVSHAMVFVKKFEELIYLQ